ncbi:pyrimidine reductase family protein [Corynebacterium sp. CCM 9185]|uniref:Pyrimidine reductase family protein n=1 Tax=Corynebacterium marambiense TaxID=2765364 RepID=A0ABS0VUZ1_9CORY|nr:pyrimidine reductase family protein [Corynebacterium marambiense]MBI9000599.1 pyrimidine reductase family protein [Corynebacterium marambiense]MCK7663138.1 pyrimidine reductase family protein [Corynebacterium marambiense]
MSDFPGAVPADVLIGPTQPVGISQIRAVSAVTLTGATTIGGTSGPLGNATDTKLLLALRSWSDVILVGAATVRAENYGRVVLSPGDRARRTSEGRPPLPRVAVVTRSFNLSPDSPLFADSEVPTLVLVPAQAYADPRLAGPRDAIIRAGGRIVSTEGGTPGEIIGCLREQGHRRIICEGGAQLLGQLVRADLIDVHHITIDPSLTLPVHPGLIAEVDTRPKDPQEHHRLCLDEVRATSDGCVFLRYTRKHPGLAP